MKLGVFTVLFGAQPLEAALDRVVDAGLRGSVALIMAAGWACRRMYLPTAFVERRTRRKGCAEPSLCAWKPW